MKITKEFFVAIISVVFVISLFWYFADTSEAYYTLGGSGQDFLDTTAGETGLDTGSDLNTQFARVSQIIFGIVGIGFLVLMVYGGFMWMTARGDEEKVNTARRNIVASVIGLVIIVSAYAISQLVLSGIIGG